MKEQSRRPPDFLSGHACLDWKWEHRGDYAQEADHRRFVARMEDTRLPKCVMFGELVGGAGCVGGHENEWMGCLLDDLKAFDITLTSGRLQLRTRGNNARRRNKERNVSWRNRSLQRSQGETTACSSMLERDGKDQG